MLSGPRCGGMSGNGKVKNPAAVVSQHQKHVQHLESDRSHRKEVDRHHSLDVIFKEGPPRRGWWFVIADHVLAHARFADGNTKLEQFAVNPRRAPQRVVAAHRTNLRIKDRTSAGTAGRPGLPRRIFHVQNSWKPLRC